MTAVYTLGIMTGNSLDATDIVLTAFENADISDIAAYSKAYPKSLTQKMLALRQKIKAVNADMSKLEQDEEVISAINEYTMEVAQTVNEFLQKTDFPKEKIAAIGFHGQTCDHFPPSIAQGKPPYTIQIGNAQMLADLTQIPVIYDFRSDDILNGGEGAPLAPVHNQHLAKALQQKGVFPVEVEGGFPLFQVGDRLRRNPLLRELPFAPGRRQRKRTGDNAEQKPHQSNARARRNQQVGDSPALPEKFQQRHVGGGTVTPQDRNPFLTSQKIMFHLPPFATCRTHSRHRFDCHTGWGASSPTEASVPPLRRSPPEPARQICNNAPAPAETPPDAPSPTRREPAQCWQPDGASSPERTAPLRGRQAPSHPTTREHTLCRTQKYSSAATGSAAGNRQGASEHPRRRKPARSPK